MGALQQGRRHEMPPLQRRENGRRLSFLLTLCHSRKLVPDVSNRGSSVLMNPVSFSLLLSVIPDPDRESSQGKNPGSLCSRRGCHAARRGRQETGAIQGVCGRPRDAATTEEGSQVAFDGTAMEEGERPTEGGMRCRHYRGWVPEGEGKKRASFWRHLRAPAGRAAPQSFLLLSF